MTRKFSLTNINVTVPNSVDTGTISKMIRQKPWYTVWYSVCVDFQTEDEGDVDSSGKVESRSSRTSESESDKGDRPQSRDGQKYPQVSSRPEFSQTWWEKG